MAEELTQVFLDESEEEIRELETGLIRLEEEGEDEDTVNRIFRAAHTIKGSAGLVGFEKVSNFTHTIENILDRIRNHELKVTKKLISRLLESVDILKKMISASLEGEELDQSLVDNVTAKLKRFTREEMATAVRPVKEKMPTEERIFSVSMSFKTDLFHTGQDPLMLIHELSEVGEILDVHPYVGAIPDFYNLIPTNCYVSWDVRLKTKKPQSEIQNVFIFVADENEIRVTDITGEYKAGVDLSLAEKPIGEILVERGIVKDEDVFETLKEH